MLGRKIVSSLQAPLTLQCVVIGGGIIGLASAIALARVGHCVIVFEQAPDLDHIHPTGFSLPPNLTKVINKWGLREAFEAFTKSWRGACCVQWTDGEIYSTARWDQEALQESGGDWAFSQFDDFYRFMVETARLSGVEVRAASHVEAVAEDGTSVRLANGQTVSADIIVAAGGVGSIVRRELLDNEEEDKGAPLLNFNVHIAGEKMRADPELASLWEDDSMVTGWWGTRFAVGFRKGISDEYTIEVLVPFSEGEDRSRPWEQPLPACELLALMGTCEPRLAKLVGLGRCFGGEQLVLRPIIHDRVHPSERVVLVGCAAHPSIPGAGAMQGTAMGFEDAAVLARLLARVSRHDQIPSLLRGFASLRHARVPNIMSFEYHHSPFAVLPRLAAAVTPEAAATQVREHCNAITRMLGFDMSGVRLWDAVGAIWAYDAEDAADDWWVEWGLPAERARGEVQKEQRIVPGTVSVERSIEVAL